ncbi:MAG: Acetylornithine deacetylase/Succinyl-diaminopimelate desuccinylase and related deacylases [uncultured Truepera sp.]|uniref:Acetylornithine deacetylase/Succinyl-diaminopimelate desuccinylase and related deacylases n=1 Tax=uncultured Truepera sp. TaxID=543023 RepID=A0A6J4VIT3_9DEIN|nr:MAG: Acetylornithine deacetylase/Succinyl-diaminopimelate desuccinylase and related deacylases [uncultured Truepera sp.]
MNVHDYLEAHKDAILRDVIEFASIPSISTDPQYQGEVARAARWVAQQLTAAGPLEVDIIETGGHPIVFAEWLGAPGKPTVLVYGHYDVQPPDPLEKWQTPPFSPTLRGDRLYARGVSDDKAPLLTTIKVAQAYFASEGRLPLNVKFLFEGEEEVGSPSLEGFIKEQAERLRADFVISADGAMWRADVPSLNVSTRGLAALEFSVFGPGKDLHSGRHGGGVANPLHAAARLIASLHDENGRVTVAGFYDDVEGLSLSERQAVTELPFDEAAYLAEVGSPTPYGEAGYTTLERQWHRPTLEVNGLWGGYQGEGSKTVIPSEAHAKITCRLVPRQDPKDIVQKLTRHLEAHQPEGVRLVVRVPEHSASAYRLPLEHPGLRAAQEVLRDLYGKEPLLVGVGGTVPVCETFQRHLKMDTVFFAFGVGDEDIHAPNEFFRVPRLHEGLGAWARLWERLGQDV